MASSIGRVEADIKNTKLIPCGDNVTVQPSETSDRVGSIIIPIQAKSVYPVSGIVLAIGKDLCDENGAPTTDYQVGYRVVFSKYAGIEMQFNEGRIFLLKHTDILAIMTEDLNFVREGA